MNPEQPIAERRRLVASALVGAVAGAVALPFAPWELSVLVAWDVTALALVSWIWFVVGRMDADDTRAFATREDGSRGSTRALTVAASIVSLVGVLFALLKASESDGAERAVLTVVAVATVVLSWALVHTLYALRYAHLYYGGPEPGGIDFKNDAEPPTYSDFAYVAFTVGMTFQISDTDIQLRVIRRAVLQHALLSYLFGTVIVASAINVIAGLLK